MVAPTSRSGSACSTASSDTGPSLPWRATSSRSTSNTRGEKRYWIASSARGEHQCFCALADCAAPGQCFNWRATLVLRELVQFVAARQRKGAAPHREPPSKDRL